MPEALAKIDLALQDEVPKMVFDAYVAVLDHFTADNSMSEKTRDKQRSERILKIALDNQRPATVRALALHDLPTDDPRTYSGTIEGRHRHRKRSPAHRSDPHFS